MGMSCINFIARQANNVNLYKNFRSKLLRCCANIYFNKQCLSKSVIPKYANTKFANTSPAAHITTKIAQITRIKDEVKFLYKKKEKLNYGLNKAHLKAAQEWGEGMWETILSSINDSLDKIMEKNTAL